MLDAHHRNHDLAETHTPDAIASRLAEAHRHSYLGDFVLGAIDGVVTTFAMVAASAGANFSGNVALILGVANLLADGFSMAVGNYLSTKSEGEHIERIRRLEHQHIESEPGGEREEIRQIFAAKGFSGELLEQIVEVITDDRKRWVDTMVTEEFGLPLATPSPVLAGLATYAAFVVAGAVPLVPLVVAPNGQSTFAWSAVATAAAFVAIGIARGFVLDRSRWRSGLETLLVGGLAAVTAFAAGYALKALGVE